MNLITTRGLIQDVAKRWRKVYGHDSEDRWPKHYITARALERLDGNTATREEVDQIIGNSSWTRVLCNECKQEVNAAVQLGDEPDYESSTATICFGCIHAAHKLFPLGSFKP